MGFFVPQDEKGAAGAAPELPAAGQFRSCLLLQNPRHKQAQHLAPPVPLVGDIAAPDLEVGGQALCGQHIGQRLRVGFAQNTQQNRYRLSRTK